MNLSFFDHFLFFIIGIAFPLFSIASARNASGGEDMPEMVLPAKKHIYFSNGLMLWIGALLVLTSWNITGKDWLLLGIKWPEWNAPTIIMSILLLGIYIGDSVYNILQFGKQAPSEEEEQTLEKILPSDWKEYSQFTFLAVSAGICEEVVFRGFIVNYIIELSKFTPYSYYLAIVIPAIIFSVSHIYQGWQNVFKIMSIALLFGGIYVWSQSLLIVIIIHVFVDLMSGAIVVIMKKRTAS